MLEEHSLCKLFRTTKYYLYFNVTQLALSLILIGTLVLSSTTHTAQLQMIIALMLAIDLLIRYRSDSDFIRKKYNQIDLALLCLVVMMMSVESLTRNGVDMFDQFGSLLLAVRFGVQVLRIVVLSGLYGDLKMLQRMGDISFGDHLIADEIDHPSYEAEGRDSQ